MLGSFLPPHFGNLENGKKRVVERDWSTDIRRQIGGMSSGVLLHSREATANNVVLKFFR
jgi:hypothetical protein